MRRLILFSSDSYRLYREDIYRAVCLPDGYVIHFRYEEHHLDQSILANLQMFTQFPNYNATVVFAGGLAVGGLPRRNIPIRNVRVRRIERTPNTGLIHFYIQLGKLANIEISDRDINAKSPPNKYASVVNVNRLPTDSALSWRSLVESLHPWFKDQNFARLSISNHHGVIQMPYFDDTLSESYFQLNGESTYLLDVSYILNDGDKDQISVKSGDPVLSVDFSDGEKMGNPIDDRRFGINVGELKAKQVTTFLRISPNGSADLPIGTNGYTATLKVKLQRSLRRSVYFGLLSSALLLLPGLKAVKDDSLLGKFEWWVFPVLIFAFCVSTGIIAALHRLYNKS